MLTFCRKRLFGSSHGLPSAATTRQIVPFGLLVVIILSFTQNALEKVSISCSKQVPQTRRENMISLPHLVCFLPRRDDHVLKTQRPCKSRYSVCFPLLLCSLFSLSVLIAQSCCAHCSVLPYGLQPMIHCVPVHT